MIPMLEETDAISCLLNERNAALNKIEVFEARIKELEAVAEAAERVDDTGYALDDLQSALRAAGYLGGGEK